MGGEETNPVPLIWTQPPPPPRRRALDREKIVAAAIRVAGEAGLDGLTMKAVAAHLGPYSPMALYRHVLSKEGLFDLMLDAATAEIPLPGDPGEDWRADLRTLALETRRMTARHPWFAVLVHARPPAGPHMMRRLEFMLTVLVQRGATVGDAMTYAALIDRHVFGSALQESEEARLERRYGLDDEVRLSAAIATLHELAAADGRLPRLTNWLAHPAGPPPEERFAIGLDFILDGIAGRLL
ncbi:TetR/AcrR family transcriptional regulator [Microbispora sp. NBC_01189]|uniref:TetR/AcrR family transcriptional regulator n=1 Tax=Microbispora sp. NBC_01189 TaxID=2903583 RepID=UPI002E11C504|nr:TetR/AcrR family transcriptional regulator [Microbispora sp. NBC_01189]